MNRRSFMDLIGATGVSALAASAGAADDKRTRYYTLENFYLKNGTQLARMHSFLKDGFLPVHARVGGGSVLCLEALVAPHMPQVAVITGYTSVEGLLSMRARAAEDTAFRKATESWEEGAEPPYEHFSTTLLAATDYSPEMAAPAEPPKAPRIYELRVYHSPTVRQNKALHERFAGPEIKIFHRVGVHPVLYSSTVFGANMPNLTYVIPFDDLAAREKAWNAFGADPEWKKVRQESIDKHGQVSSVIQISLFRAAEYSPLR